MEGHTRRLWTPPVLQAESNGSGRRRAIGFLPPPEREREAVGSAGRASEGKGKRSTRRDQANQLMSKGLRARDMDPVRVSPFGPAARNMPHSSRPDRRLHLTAQPEPLDSACNTGGVHRRLPPGSVAVVLAGRGDRAADHPVVCQRDRTAAARVRRRRGSGRRWDGDVGQERYRGRSSRDLSAGGPIAV